MSTIDAVSPSVTNFKLLLLFCFSMELSQFLPRVLHDPSTKRCSSIFDLGPLTPKIYSPKLLAITLKFGGCNFVTSLTTCKIFAPNGVLQSGRFNGTMQNVAGPTLVAMAMKFGLFLHKIACKLACTADRPEMFGPTRGFSEMADSMEPWMQNVGPTLVAMAMKFGLGAEIQSPTGLFSM